MEIKRKTDLPKTNAMRAFDAVKMAEVLFSPMMQF